MGPGLQDGFENFEAKKKKTSLTWAEVWTILLWLKTFCCRFQSAEESKRHVLTAGSIWLPQSKKLGWSHLVFSSKTVQGVEMLTEPPPGPQLRAHRLVEGRH